MRTFLLVTAFPIPAAGVDRVSCCRKGRPSPNMDKPEPYPPSLSEQAEIRRLLDVSCLETGKQRGNSNRCNQSKTSISISENYRISQGYNSGRRFFCTRRRGREVRGVGGAAIRHVMKTPKGKKEAPWPRLVQYLFLILSPTRPQTPAPNSNRVEEMGTGLLTDMSAEMEPRLSR